MNRHLLKAAKLSAGAKDSKPTESKVIFTDKKIFPKIHEYLVKKGIIDGSNDNLVKDILDEPNLAKNFAYVTKVLSSRKSVAEKIRSLVYLAIAGFAKSKINQEVRIILRDHLKECNEAMRTSDFTIVQGFVKSKKVKIADLDERTLKQILASRIYALQTVLRLRGDHFLKRSYYVAPDFKIDYDSKYLKSGK